MGCIREGRWREYGLKVLKKKEDGDWLHLTQLTMKHIPVTSALQGQRKKKRNRKQETMEGKTIHTFRNPSDFSRGNNRVGGLRTYLLVSL